MTQRRLRSGYVSANALSVSNLSRSRLDFTSFNIRPPGRCDRFYCRAARAPRERIGDGPLISRAGVARMLCHEQDRQRADLASHPVVAVAIARVETFREAKAIARIMRAFRAEQEPGSARRERLVPTR
jgi:hypothetical protein